jgi:hypothetical protein
MRIPKEHIQKLQSFGYTEREARFLYIVAIHSGYFTQQQYTEFGPKRAGCITHGFTSKLIARGHAIEHKYQNNARVFHFTHKGMYSAIGKENLRNRRKHTFEFMKTRLAMLDFVLGHLQHDYFESEAEKVQYFEQRFGIRPQDMPGRTYRGANKVPDTIRYFVDKFPMFLESNPAGLCVPTFTFVDPGAQTPDTFKTHMSAYASFLARIPHFAFIFASPSAKLFAAAQKLFHATVNPPISKLLDQLTRYFRLRADWEAKRYELLKDSDIEFMNHARQCFAGQSFEQAYTHWKAARLTQRDALATLEKEPRLMQKIEFRTYLLPRNYSSFDQNSHFSEKVSLKSVFWTVFYSVF